MPVFTKATCDTYHADGLVQNAPVEVRLGDGSIAISYEDDDGLFTVYDGSENEPGHFRLECPRKKGKATLHRVPDEDILEGWWLEAGYEGMWRIDLNIED